MFKKMFKNIFNIIFRSGVIIRQYITFSVALPIYTMLRPDIHFLLLIISHSYAQLYTYLLLIAFL